MKKVIVTTSWDDGHVLDMKLADLLRKYKIAATFYVAPENHEFSPEERLNMDQVKELSKDFEIGAHTMTHPRLSRIDQESAFQEILDSKQVLEDWTGKKVTSFCYPYGDYNAQTRSLVRKAEFQLGRTVSQMVTNPNPKDQYELGTSIEFTPISIFGLYGLCKFAVKNKNARLFKYLSRDNERNAYRLFDFVYEHGGVYHLWGHSSLINQRQDFMKLESLLQYISERKDVLYLTNHEIRDQFDYEK